MPCQYRQFMFASSREIAAEIGRLIRAKRPEAGYFNYIQEIHDGIMSESNTAVDRPLPLWPYRRATASIVRETVEPGENVRQSEHAGCATYSWRFATVPRRRYRSAVLAELAHGGAADLRGERNARLAGPAGAWRLPNRSFAGSRRTSSLRRATERCASFAARRSAAPGQTFSEAAYRGAYSDPDRTAHPFCGVRQHGLAWETRLRSCYCDRFPAPRNCRRMCKTADAC